MQKNPLVERDLVPNHNLLKHKGFLYLLVLFFLVKIGLSLLWPNKNLTLASDLNPQNILSAVNEQRSLRNLVTLNPNSKLTLAAQSKSDDMQTRHYFAHIDPDGHYIWDKIVADGYTPYTQLGENLAIEFYDTNSLVNAWMNSPTHRANILQEGFKDQGMGLTFGDSSVGQYHSAIANTFGTLAFSATPKASLLGGLKMPKATTKPAPKPSAPVVKKPAPKTLGSEQTATSPVTAPVSDQTPIITPREEMTVAVEDSSNFALPDQSAQPSPAPPSPAARAPTSAASSGVVGNKDATTFSGYQINRYLILFAGLALLVLMFFDLRKAVQNKFSSLDKKANNLAVLLISIVVVAFMYWL